MLRDGANNAPPQHERRKFDPVQNPFALRRRVVCAASKDELENFNNMLVQHAILFEFFP
jgi:hypothetical protein